jgi:hypothetical protein
MKRSASFINGGLFVLLVFLEVHFLFVKCDAHFFIGGHFEHFAFLGAHFLFVTCDASFFIGGLFQPMNEGSDSMRLLMA